MDYAKQAVERLHRIMHKHKNGPFAEMEGMFKGEMMALNLLHVRGVLTPSELAQGTCSSTARVATILGGLEQKGQIAREIDRQDRRKILVTITDGGRSRVEQMRRQMELVGCEVFQEMGEGDTGEFLRLLDRFLNLIDERMGPDDPARRDRALTTDRSKERKRT